VHCYFLIGFNILLKYKTPPFQVPKNQKRMSANPKKSGNLFSEFPPLTKAEWTELVRRQLKPGEHPGKLEWKTLEGFTAPPYMTREEFTETGTSTTAQLRNNTSWKLAEPVFDAQPSDANQSIIQALDAGADTLLIRSIARKGEGVPGSDLTGTQVQSQDDFNTLIKNIEDRETEFIFDTGAASPAFLALVQNSAIASERATFLYDPFSLIAKHGRLPLPQKKLNSLIRSLADESRSRTFCADASFWHHCGATIVQELGVTLAILSEFLASSEPKQREKTAQLCLVRMAAGPLFFPEIAKFRALRLMWKQLLQAYNIQEHPPLIILAETSRINKTITDPYNNMIRSVTEAMSAITGGADYLMVQPWNELFEEPDEFSKRIARNVQHILREEAYFDKVADPAAGSYYIQTLTDTIGRESWNVFRRIEKEGGIVTALKNELLQDEISKSKKTKETAYCTGKRVLAGTNHYPNPEESLPGNIRESSLTTSLRESPYMFSDETGGLLASLKHAFRDDALLGDLITSVLDPQKVLFKTTETYRAGQVFDEIRLRTEEFFQKSGTKPSVQIVPIGDPKWRNLRASFARNILGCAGFRIDQPAGFESVEDAAVQLKESNAEMYVLCSSDRDYEKLAVPFCNTFGTRGLLILAGQPGDYESEWRNAGIDDFIWNGMNLPEFLTVLQHQLFEREKG
jgi:methylmalonyl-CoA mutase